MFFFFSLSSEMLTCFLSGFILISPCKSPLLSVNISAQKCDGFAVSSNYKEPDCMSVLSLWLH